MNIKDKWFCIGQSGPTVDGREIASDDLVQAAESYNPNTYTAVLNVEHYRPFFPKSELGGLGSVIELKAETENSVTKLYARLDPTAKTQQMMKDREKVFTSMELQKNFANTGKTYLIGLALTDSPASLGTSMLKFTVAADQQEILSNYTEMEEKMSEKQTIWGKLHSAMFTKPVAPKNEEGQEPKVTEDAKGKPEEKQEYSALRQELEQAAKVVAQLVDDNEKSAAAFAALKEDFEKFKAQVEVTPVNAQAPHLGGATKQVSEF